MQNKINFNYQDNEIILTEEMMPSHKFEKFWNFFKSLSNGSQLYYIDSNDNKKISVGVQVNGIWNTIPLQLFNDIMTQGVNEQSQFKKLFGKKKILFQFTDSNKISFDYIVEDKIFMNILRQHRIPSVNLNREEKETILTLNIISQIKSDKNHFIKIDRNGLKDNIISYLNSSEIKNKPIIKIGYRNIDLAEVSKLNSKLDDSINLIDVKNGFALVYDELTKVLTIYKA